MILRNFLYIILFLLLLFFGLRLWLKFYTDHGDSVVLPDFIGMSYDEALKKAEDASFEFELVDSIFVVGKGGGEILEQVPAPTSKVKEGRTVYITITKYVTEKIPVRRLPVLYGALYERKKRELEQGFEINTKILGYEFDPGEPDHILAVVYEGDTIISSRSLMENIEIEKGGTLGMVLSKKTGGIVEMPDLYCKSYDEAVFIIQNRNLYIKSATAVEGLEDVYDGYVNSQYPDPYSTLYIGDSVTFTLIQNIPADCAN